MEKHESRAAWRAKKEQAGAAKKRQQDEQECKGGKGRQRARAVQQAQGAAICLAPRQAPPVGSRHVLLDACHRAVHQLVPEPRDSKGAADHGARPHQQA